MCVAASPCNRFDSWKDRGKSRKQPTFFLFYTICSEELLYTVFVLCLYLYCILSWAVPPGKKSVCVCVVGQMEDATNHVTGFSPSIQLNIKPE